MSSRGVLATVAAACLLTGCAANKVEHAKGVTLDGRELSALMSKLPDKKLNDPYIRDGVENLSKGDYIEASKAFNRALKFDPVNGNLHFLNALTYHLRAETGDGSQYDLAKAGYDLALRYDPGNYWAAYLLGQILMHDQTYRRAQDAFAYALLYAPDNVSILNAMAAASYLAQDLASATKAIKHAVELEPHNREIQYNSILIDAAAKRFDAAEKELAVYRTYSGKKTAFRAAYLTRRLKDWQYFYDNKLYLKEAQFSPGDIFGGKSTPDPNSTNQPGPGSSPASPSATSPNASDAAADGKNEPKMALIDVAIIRSEEIHSTDKGLNLLNGLTATLGGTTITYNGTNFFRSGGRSTASLVFAPTLSLAFTSYSLNIFTDNYDRNEVLARPTLVALDGQPSTFFSGAVWHIALNGTAGSQGSVQDVNVGIHLDVTPTFLSPDTMRINVSASRAFIEAIDSAASFGTTPAAQTTDTKVTANVVMKFGETLVLSGLSERETEKLNDGVPILQNIPLIQYLFSHEDTLDSTKSVLVLLTPRKPRYTFANGVDKMEPLADKDEEQPHVKELQGREIWFKPASNLDAVFYHLQNGSFFKEFRQGDLSVEQWDTPHSIENMIINSLQFLYY